MAQMNMKGNSNKFAFGPTVLMKIVTGTQSTNVFLLTIVVNFAVNEAFSLKIITIWICFHLWRQFIILT